MVLKLEHYFWISTIAICESMFGTSHSKFRWREKYFYFLYPQIYEAVSISHKRGCFYWFVGFIYVFQIRSPKHKATKIQIILCIHIGFRNETDVLVLVLIATTSWNHCEDQRNPRGQVLTQTRCSKYVSFPSPAYRPLF